MRISNGARLARAAALPAALLAILVAPVADALEPRP
jgi:hypothetical protein